MTSIDPTVRLAQTRSLIDSVQQEIEQLESLMADFIAAEGEESSTSSDSVSRRTSTSGSDIKADFRAWQEAKDDLTPSQQLEVLSSIAYDAGFIRDQHGAWTEFAEQSGSSAVTRQALAVLKASLGALRVEESYWNNEQQEQQKMQKSSNEIAKL